MQHTRMLVLFIVALTNHVSGRKLDSRAPDTLYQTIVRTNAQVGGEVSGEIVPNAWLNGDEQPGCPLTTSPPTSPPTNSLDDLEALVELVDEPMIMRPDYYNGGWNLPPVLVCDQLPDDFSLNVEIKLEWTGDKNSLSETTQTIRPNEKKNRVMFKLPVPLDVMMTKPEQWSSLRLTFKTYLANGTAFGVPENVYITLAERESVMVQSDKGKYKPGDVVNFRFLFMDINVQPTTFDMLTYTITSPSNNKMSQKTVDKFEKSVYTGLFKLDQYAEEGKWKIEVEAKNKNSDIKQMDTFVVEKYVLPTFEVKIGTNRNFIILGEEGDVPIKIDATYTFGQPVSGSATVVIKKMPCTRSYGYYYEPQPLRICAEFDLDCPEYDENGCEKPPELIMDLKKYKGRFTDAIDRDNLERIASFEDENGGWRCNCGSNLMIQANVTDKYSGEMISSEMKLDVKNDKYRVTFIYSPDGPREGLPFEFIAKAEYIDGSGLDFNGSVTCEYKDTRNYDNRNETIIYEPIITNGYFSCIVPESHRTKTEFVITATFDDNEGHKYSRTSSDKYYYKTRQISKELITITTPVTDRKLVPGETVTFNVKANYDSAGITFVVVAKSEIKFVEVYSDISKDEPKSIPVVIDFDMVPEVRFLAYENRGGSWNADSLSFFVNEDLEHKVSLAPSKNKTKVGEQVNIDITADANSEVFLLGVDKSVLLLAEGNAVTKRKMIDVMQAPSKNSWRPWNIWGGCGWWFPWSYGNTAEQKIRDAGYSIVAVKSNEEHLFSAFRPVFAASNIESAALFDSMGGGAASEAQIKTRKNFPETWIWDSVTTDENGNANYGDLTIPDTITSWIVTGFGLSDKKGFGVADQASILAFQDFFIKVQLPYSIKQGEEFVLKATVYNYLGYDAGTTIKLAQDLSSFIVILGGEQTVRIASGQAHTANWVIRATKSGVIPIKISAMTENKLAGDAVERLLIVKPEGIPKSVTGNTLLSGNDKYTGSLSFPATTVEGSKRIEVRLFANILANTLENIDELLHMPTGCGEQNMYNFAPAVFIYDYLQKTNSLTPEIEAKAIRYIQTGYQRELEYRHKTGGYSAFGESSYHRDPPQASTVLTSFVVKCFTAANRLLKDDFVDDAIIHNDMQFLALTADKDGNFVESGRVFSSQLMGALKKDGDIAVTAYVAIALAENYETLDKLYHDLLEEAVSNMASQLSEDLSSHTLAMITYIFHLVDHKMKGDALDLVLSQSTQKKGYKQWLVKEKYSGGMRANVEIGSYVLLAYAQSDDPNAIDNALEVFMGIQREMSETGGFQSTQDTVIGIQAMAIYASKYFNNDIVDMDVTVEAIDAQGTSTVVGDPIKITQDDAMIVRIQNIDLPDNVANVRVSSTGEGTVFTQLVQHYYVSENDVDPFDVTFEYTKKSPLRRRRRDPQEHSKNFCIEITAKSSDSDTGNGMSLVIVEHPSGYIFDSYKEIADDKTVKKQESNGEKTTFYFDDLMDAKVLEVCLKYHEKVSNPRPVFVSVQDYYNPKATSGAKVELLDRQGESACDLCGCACTECYNEIDCSTVVPDDDDDEEAENDGIWRFKVFIIDPLEYCRFEKVDVQWLGLKRIKPLFFGPKSVTSKVIYPNVKKFQFNADALYTGFFRFPKKYCGQSFLDNLLSGQLQLDIQDSTKWAYSVAYTYVRKDAGNSVAVVQFNAFGKGSFGSKKQDMFYLELIGRDNVVFGKKNIRTCLKKTTIGYMSKNIKKDVAACAAWQKDYVG